MFYDRLKEACALRGEKITPLINELEMSRGNLSSWKDGNVPKADTLGKLAARLNVSVDYLLEKTDDPATSGAGVNINDDLEYIGQKARELAPEQRKAYMDMMKKFADQLMEFNKGKK